MPRMPQEEQYQRDGYLFLPDYYSLDEVARLREPVNQALAVGGVRTVAEANKQAVRSIYGVHQHSPVFSQLSRHRKLAALAEELLAGQSYIYQSKLNFKAAFEGDRWDWHQDFIFWQLEDGMPAPKVLTAMVFLDDVTEFNGPLMLIPGSHREGVLPSATYEGKPQGYEDDQAWIANLTAQLKYSVHRDALARLVEKNGLVAPKGRAGSVLFFHGNLVHASQQNMSPFPRTILLLTYNRVDNAPKLESLRRPDFLVSRDTRPVQIISDELSILLAS